MLHHPWLSCSFSPPGALWSHSSWGRGPSLILSTKKKLNSVGPWIYAGLIDIFSVCHAMRALTLCVPTMYWFCWTSLSWIKYCKPKQGSDITEFPITLAAHVERAPRVISFICSLRHIAGKVSKWTGQGLYQYVHQLSLSICVWKLGRASWSHCIFSLSQGGPATRSLRRSIGRKKHSYYKRSMSALQGDRKLYIVHCFCCLTCCRNAWHSGKNSGIHTTWCWSNDCGYGYLEQTNLAAGCILTVVCKMWRQ